MFFAVDSKFPKQYFHPWSNENHAWCIYKVVYMLGKKHQNARTGVCDYKKLPGEKSPDSRLKGRLLLTRPGRGAFNAARKVKGMRGEGQRSLWKGRRRGGKEIGEGKDRMVPPTFETKVTPLPYGFTLDFVSVVISARCQRLRLSDTQIHDIVVNWYTWYLLGTTINVG